jgi:hypothetical protein
VIPPPSGSSDRIPSGQTRSAIRSGSTPRDPRLRRA